MGKKTILIILIAIGMIFVSSGGYFLYRESRIRNWPVASGVILNAEVIRISRSGSSPSFKPSVSYKYQVNGKEFTGKRVSNVSRTYGNSADAEAVIADYTQSRQVSVYYNPQNPQDSVLKHQSGGISYFMLFFGLLLSSSAFVLKVHRKTDL